MINHTYTKTYTQIIIHDFQHIQQSVLPQTNNTTSFTVKYIIPTSTDNNHSNNDNTTKFIYYKNA